MMFKYLLLPSRKQFAKWKLPSKYTTIGFYIALFTLIFSITVWAWSTYQESKFEYDAVKKSLEDLNRDKNWGELSLVLNEIKNREQLSDLYYYFLGRFTMFNTTPGLYDPKYYFDHVSPTSEFYFYSRNSLFFYYSSIKYKGNKAQVTIHLKELADGMERNNTKLPFYYFIRITNNQTNFDDLIGYYDDFKDSYRSAYDFSKRTLYIKTNEGEVKVFSTMRAYLSIPTLDLLFQIGIALAAHNECLLEEKKETLETIKLIIRNSKKEDLIEEAEQFMMSGRALVLYFEVYEKLTKFSPKYCN